MSNIRPLTPKQEDRRQRILAAARKMVADQGYDGMVMSQVAEAAGVSPTTLYNLYNTKDELLLEALRELLIENYQRRSALVVEPGWEMLLARVENGARLRQEEPAYGEAITNALLRAVPGDALTQLLFDAVREDYQHSLEKMAGRGELLPGVDIHHLSVLMLGNYWSTYTLLNKGVEKNAGIVRSVKINLLSLLIAASRGEAREAMEVRLAAIREEPAEEAP